MNVFQCYSVHYDDLTMEVGCEVGNDLTSEVEFDAALINGKVRLVVLIAYVESV